MSISIKIAAFCAATALFSSSAFAQSSYQCVGGELLGGPQGFACEQDAQGRIINVKPRAYTQARPAPTPQPRATTVYRGTSPSTVHTPRIRTVTHTAPAPQTRTYTQRQTYHEPSQGQRPQTYTRQQAPVTQTYSSHSHAPRTQTYTHSHAPTTYTQSTYTTRSTYSHARTRPHTTYRHAPTAPVYYTPHQPAVAPAYRRCDPTLQRLRNTRDGARRFEVCFADLTPLGFSGAEALYNRIQTAARRACRNTSSFSLISNSRSCRRDAIKQAVIDVNSPSLDTVYAERTGRSIPRVRVGRPIYR